MGLITRLFKTPSGGLVGIGSEGSVTLPDSQVRVRGGGATNYGSSGTTTRRFFAVESTFGSAITYTASATNGDSWTINSSGIYHITYSDKSSVQLRPFGISVNGVTTDNIAVQPTAARILFGLIPASNVPDCVSGSFRLSTGDIIRAQSDGNADFTTSSTDAGVYVTITQIVKL